MPDRGKWKKYYDLPEIQEIRNRIRQEYAEKIVFLEGPHEYYIDGESYPSVSEVTHRYKPVDSEQMAENCVKKWKREQDRNYKYFGMSKEEILAEWAEKSGHACEFGTEVHAFGESMFYFMTGNYDGILPECSHKFTGMKPCPTNKQEEAVLRFWDDLPYNFVPVLAETKVFNRNGTRYCGTFDLLIYYVDEERPEKSGLVIFDYKTNEDLYKNYRGQTLLWPFQDMLDQNVSYYTLQLGLYQIPLENLGYKVIARRLIWVRPDGTYENVRIKDISEKMRYVLDIPSSQEIIEKQIL